MKTTINCWSPATRIWMLAAGAVALSLRVCAVAQDTPKPQEPEYANAFFLLDSGGNLKLLEPQPVGVGGKGSAASLKITPASPLAPGEYAIAAQTRDQQPTAYCFGIDAATK